LTSPILLATSRRRFLQYFAGSSLFASGAISWGAISAYGMEAPSKLASGIDDEVTLRANREGFLKFQLLLLRLTDVSKNCGTVGRERKGDRVSLPHFC
jgi:4-hydroxymandelate oxidase